MVYIECLGTPSALLAGKDTSYVLRMVSVLRLDQRIGSVDCFGDEQAQFFVKLPQYQVMCVR